MDGAACLILAIILFIMVVIIWYVGKKDSLGSNKGTPNAPPPNYGEGGPPDDQSDLGIGTTGSMNSQSNNQRSSTRDCPACGGSVPPESKFCPICGEDIEQDDETTAVCSFCGKIVAKSVSNCPRCGSEISSKGRTSDESTPPPDAKTENYGNQQATEEEIGPRSEESDRKEEIFCPDCGNQLDLDEIGEFCPQCGNDISDLKDKGESDEAKEEISQYTEQTFERRVTCPNCNENFSQVEFEQSSPFCPRCEENIVEPEKEDFSETEEDSREEELKDRSEEREEVTFTDEEKKRYKEKIDEWDEIGFDVKNLRELLMRDEMEKFKRDYRLLKKQIEGEVEDGH